METGIVSVATITVISYFVAQAVKATKLNNKWLPVICGGVGAALGYVAMLVMPGYPASDPLTAVAVGIVSGLAATGSNELVKQLKGCSSDDENNGS
ncbi:MAG: enolase [Clostridia bacterium]|nr:enolase [Clostridia bacterium]